MVRVTVHQLLEAYHRGYTAGVYGVSYINPHYTPSEMNAFATGYKDGLDKRKQMTEVKHVESSLH